MVKFLFMFFILQVPLPYPVPPVKEGSEKKIWMPYNFKGTEYFKYDVKATENGKVKKGYEIIDIKKSGDKYTIKIEGKFGESEGTFTTTVEDKEDIPGAIVAQGMWSPYLLPLTIALFSPAWAIYFGYAGFSFEEGSKWRTKDEEGNVTEMEVKGSEEYAGKKGKKLIVKQNGKEIWVIVWSEDVALPLYIKTGEGENVIFELKLVEYRE